MKRFIIRVLVFCLPLLLTAVAILVIFQFKIKDIRLDDSIKVLIVGDSHTQTALNDSLIPQSINLSQSSEHFLYTYNVLRLLLENNPQLERVVLGVSFHSFGERYDTYINDGEKVQFMFPKYFPILEPSSVADLRSFPLKQIYPMYKNVFKFFSPPKSIHHYPFLGDFYYSERSSLTDSIVNATIQRHYYEASGETVGFAFYQQKYLEKIVTLCEQQQVQLTLINSPLHPSYTQKIPAKFKEHYYTVLKELGETTQLIDWHELRFPEEAYGDGDHLNAIGAKQFTPVAAERLGNL